MFQRPLASSPQARARSARNASAARNSNQPRLKRTRPLAEKQLDAAPAAPGTCPAGHLRHHCQERMDQVPSSPTTLPTRQHPRPHPDGGLRIRRSAGIKRKTCGLKAPHTARAAERISARPPSRGIPSSPASENEPILERARRGERGRRSGQ